MPARGQSRFQIAAEGGSTFTSAIKYKNCTGYINPALTLSITFLYKPGPAIGIELQFSDLSNPVSYLNNVSDNTVKIYTTSHITLEHLLGGFNYYVPVKNIHPYMGLLLGASYAATKETSPPSSIYNFTCGLQTGSEFTLSKSIDLRLNGSVIITPGVANNTSYFNVGADGGGFPSFIVGDPSRAAITQWNISLGVLINLKKKKLYK